jgi:hypothetical protein
MILDQELVKIELNPNLKLEITGAFLSFTNQFDAWQQQNNSIVVTDATHLKAMTEAGTLRKEIKKARVAVEKKRVELKKDSLDYGKAVDKIAKLIEGKLTPLEEELSKKENFLIIQENERLNVRRDMRIARIKDLEYAKELLYDDLLNMSDEKFEDEIVKSKLLFEHKQAEAKRIEEERIAEEARIKAEQEERSRVIREEREAERKALIEEQQRLAAEAQKEKERADELRKQLDEANKKRIVVPVELINNAVNELIVSAEEMNGEIFVLSSDDSISLETIDFERLVYFIENEMPHRSAIIKHGNNNFVFMDEDGNPHTINRLSEILEIYL